jgi:hypothetical protein
MVVRIISLGEMGKSRRGQLLDKSLDSSLVIR